MLLLRGECITLEKDSWTCHYRWEMASWMALMGMDAECVMNGYITFLGLRCGFLHCGFLRLLLKCNLERLDLLCESVDLWSVQRSQTDEQADAYKIIARIFCFMSSLWPPVLPQTFCLNRRRLPLILWEALTLASSPVLPNTLFVSPTNLFLYVRDIISDVCVLQVMFYRRHVLFYQTKNNKTK